MRNLALNTFHTLMKHTNAHKMTLIDTHAHLYDPKYKANIDEVIATCQAEGIARIYLPNLNNSTVAPMVALEKKHPLLFRSMLGLHPCDVKANFKEELRTMSQWFTKHNFVAIGEVGLDLYWDRTYLKEQIKVLHTSIDWALAHQIPLVLHARNALDQLIAIIQERHEAGLKGVFHCFNGTTKQMEQIVSLGFHMGIGGIVTFAKETFASVIRSMPLANMLLETDSPYLTPHPHRGKTNSPHYLPYIAQKIADIRTTSVAAIATATTTNAQHLFALTDDPQHG